MKNHPRFASEQVIAGELLLRSSAIATPLLGELSGWLMTGLGAAFALFIANLDSVLKYIYPQSFRWAVIWFCASLLLGLLARVLAASVASGLSSHEVFSKRAGELITPDRRFSLRAFMHYYLSGLLLPYKCIATRSHNKTQAGDLICSQKLIAKNSQTHAILVLFQISFAVLSIVVLGTGVKV